MGNFRSLGSLRVIIRIVHTGDEEEFRSIRNIVADSLGAALKDNGYKFTIYKSTEDFNNIYIYMQADDVDNSNVLVHIMSGNPWPCSFDKRLILIQETLSNCTNKDFILKSLPHTEFIMEVDNCLCSIIEPDLEEVKEK